MRPTGRDFQAMLPPLTLLVLLRRGLVTLAAGAELGTASGEDVELLLLVGDLQLGGIRVVCFQFEFVTSGAKPGLH